MAQRDLLFPSIAAPGEMPQETDSLFPPPGVSSLHLSPLPLHAQQEMTPSATTITLPTPEPVHAQLASVEYRNPPRFIFYPISWDDPESPPPSAGVDHCSTKSNPNKLDIPDEVCGEVDEELLDSASAACSPENPFLAIDRWRRNVIKCSGGAPSELLEPIQDADIVLPLLSLPRNDDRAPEAWEAAPFRRDSNASDDDEIRIWIHPLTVSGGFDRL
ncbi:hypothetical protein HYDPIDRAFT_30675 [Hydnomerulius pinastri MD-312]|uniref:Uncharacterized protein n=1 Tax=Hydnomerulius pinastri MD-312 TaxID=994086 RepID=A0A0C9W5U5_9AGAM|nr:hypothetical protein HYDPIDRAFT_30675 [Hydnomerulius pinastri MD-312]